MRIADPVDPTTTPEDWGLRRCISLAVGGGIAISLVSISLSYICFGVVLLLWIIHCLKSGKLHLKAPPFWVWVGGFVAASGVAIVFSSDVPTSLPSLSKHIRFLWIPMVYTYLGRRQVEYVLQAVFGVAGISAAYGILQYFWLREVDLLHRISGFMGHWMTFSGQLMLCSVALGGYLLYLLNPETRKAKPALSGQPSAGTVPFWVWALLWLVVSFALALTQTRNSWLGTLVGLLLLLWVYRRRWIVPGLILVVILFMASPEGVKQRLYSGLDPNDVTTQGRLELLRTGRNIIAAHPWTGLGPRMVPRLYQDYNESDAFPAWTYQHLHNNFVQIAAEMGLITLICWVAIWIRLLWDFVSFASRPAVDGYSTYSAVSSMAVLTAFLTAGLLEYNFGDSEILILLLFFMTVPYVMHDGPE
ncbi:MAG: O-antigen ligase family protein [Acidobacteriota bacterium]